MTFDLKAIQAHQILCGFLARQLYCAPVAADLEKLIAQRELLLEEPFSTLNPQASQTLFDVLAKAASAQGEAAELLVALQRDFTFLFKMVGVSLTSPYESFYRTDDRTVFGPTTLEVRAAYAAIGLELAEQGREPEDHIGLEFLFLEQLFAQLAAHFESDDVQAAAQTTNTIAAFLKDHLLVFAGEFFKNVQTQASSDYFKAIACLGESALHSLAGFSQGEVC